jgi:hypothetical protein
MPQHPIRVLASLATTGALLLGLAPDALAANVTRPQVVKAAKRQKGVPYVWGGASRRGFDCSGLVQYVFAKAHIPLPRTADQQYAYGSPVPLAQAKPGDLMFFNTGHRQGEVTHVGIYMGNGHMIHAPRPGKKVQFASVKGFFASRLVGVRRIRRQTFALAQRQAPWPPARLTAIDGMKLPYRDAVITASMM